MAKPFAGIEAWPDQHTLAETAFETLQDPDRQANRLACQFPGLPADSAFASGSLAGSPAGSMQTLSVSVLP